MARRETLNGNCYLCGAELSKISMKNHILKAHQDMEGEQDCFVLKIEGAYDKNYWLYIDIPKDKALTQVDGFLRKIWLECCGHLSAFIGQGHSQIGKARKLTTFSIGDKIGHEYDFGSTTETVITFVAESRRKKQKEAVRLLARNIPYEFTCNVCGKPADSICTECMYDSDNPFFCENCCEEHEHDYFLSVTNSPRMGECGYDGELDVYEFKQK